MSNFPSQKIQYLYLKNQISSIQTSFDKGITQFSFFITHTVLILVLFILIASSFLKHDPFEILLFAIALAVGLTPEFLPMIITVTLVKGAMRMARKHVIVKNLSVIQNFGSMDIFCSDKTGTLTSGQIILERYIDSIGNISQKTLLLASLSSLFSTEIQNPFNRLTLHKSIHLNPTDVAIVRHEHPDMQSYHKIDEIPFSFERRCSSVVVANQYNILLITKGAPECIFNVCQYYEHSNQINLINTEKLAQFKALFQSLCNQGYRVLAIAYRELTAKDNYFIEDEIQLTLAGFLIFTDSPYPEAAKAISILQQLSIEVKVHTGDNELVTRHICKQLGLMSDNILCSDEIDKLSEQKLAKLIETTTIFARVSLLQKHKIIELLKKHGHVVDYLGDGINDAPALHTADVGISVANATDIAKESADIILLKQTLRVLTLGILEGRRSFGNIMKYLIMSTSSNLGNVFSMAITIMFLPFLPMTPTQLLLNNFPYDFAQITIPTDKVDSQFMRKPKRWDIRIIRRFMLYAGPISSLFDFLTFYILLMVFHASTALFQTGWFVESFATQTLVIFIIRTTKNPFLSQPSTPLMITVLTTIGIVIWLPFSPLAKWLGFVPLPLHYLVFLSCTIPTYLLLIEYIKRKLF